MSNDNKLIESFCNFMSDAEGLTKEEMISDLENEGVDIFKLRERAAETVSHCLGKRRLSWRNDAITKQQLIGKLLESKRTIMDASNLREKIKDIISGSLGVGEGIYAEAYFRKIESLSDDDLESLVEDFNDLELLDYLEDKNDK